MVCIQVVTSKEKIYHHPFCLYKYPGLAAYIFTNNVQRTWRVSEALEYGLVGVNEGIISTEVGFTLATCKEHK